MTEPGGDDWGNMRLWATGLLEQQTGEDIDTWNAKVAASDIADPEELRRWLSDVGVTGYPRMLLVMERFGYPKFEPGESEDMIEAQFGRRPEMRAILDELLVIANELGEVRIEVHVDHVALLTPWRQFAVIQPGDDEDVCLGLRVGEVEISGRLQEPVDMVCPDTTVAISLEHPDDVDAEITDWLKRAFSENV